MSQEQLVVQFPLEQVIKIRDLLIAGNKDLFEQLSELNRVIAEGQSQLKGSQEKAANNPNPPENQDDTYTTDDPVVTPLVPKGKPGKRQ